MAEKSSKKKNKEMRTLESAGPKLVCLEIDQISLYDRNPRTVRNPEYERIKHSIANHGLEQPLIVTRRPGEQSYFVKAGGNTRLQILKDLYQATGDPSYAMANCIEVGWEDESAVLLGHLLENSLRGDLTFIDQAAAVCAYGEMYAEENGSVQLSIRDLHSALKENGLPISLGVLSRMRYAADVLSSTMPVALSDGIGHRLVAKISRLHRDSSQLWVRTDIGSEDEFDAVFGELCRRYDGPDWQLEPLQRAVEVEIAEAGEVSIQTVRMSMDASRLAALPPPESSEPVERFEPIEESLSLIQNGDPRTRTEAKRNDYESENRMLTVCVDLDNNGGDDEDHSEHVQDRPFVDLRRRAYGLAKSLSTSFRLGELVVPLPDCGNGFLLSDFPDETLLDRLDGDSRATIGTMWWQLFAFSEVAGAPLNVIQERLPMDSDLRHILEEENVEFLFDRIDIVNAAHFADRFWARLPRREWQDWLYLAHTHREIRQKVIEMERPLWPRES